MWNGFRGHRDQLAADQLEPLVLVQDARLDHRLYLGDRETPARQTLGGAGETGEMEQFTKFASWPAMDGDPSTKGLSRGDGDRNFD